MPAWDRLKRKGRPEGAKHSAYHTIGGQSAREIVGAMAGVMVHFGIGSVDVLGRPAIEARAHYLLQRFSCAVSFTTSLVALQFFPQ